MTYSHALSTCKRSKGEDFKREQKGECGFRLLKYKANSFFATGQRDRQKVVLNFSVKLGCTLTIGMLTCTVNCSKSMNERQF